MKFILLISLTIFLVACNSGGGSSSSDPAPRDGQDNRPGDEEPTPRKCISSRVLEISDDGLGVISNIRKRGNYLARWNYNNPTEYQRVNYSFTPFAMSADAKTVVRKFSFKRYEIIRFNTNKKISFNKTVDIRATSYPRPTVDFSHDGRKIIFNFTPSYNQSSQALAIYDINSRMMKYIDIPNMVNSKLSLDNQAIYVVIKQRRGYALRKIEVDTGNTLFTKKFDTFTSFKQIVLGQNVVGVHYGKALIFYDNVTGEYAHKINAESIYDIDNTKNYLLYYASWANLKVLDLNNAQVLYNLERPVDVAYSSCQLISGDFKLVCKNQNNQNQVILWKLDSNTFEKKCL